MATVRIKNRTLQPLSVPRPLNTTLKAGAAKELEVIDVDSTFNDPRIRALVTKGHMRLEMVQDDTPDTGATLPFYTTAQLPTASDNPGMMVYNTTEEQVQLSDGTMWLGVETILMIGGALPAPASLPAGYLVWSKDDQSLYINSGSMWLMTQANGVRGMPGHVFPTPNSVAYGTMIIDTDSKQLRVSDQSRWLNPCYANEYSSYSSLPLPTNVATGNLAFVSDTRSLYVRIGGSWLTTAGTVQLYPTFGDLPTNATYGNEEKGAIAYIDDDRTMVIWGGKYWRYLMTPEKFTTATLPAASGYIVGHIIYNTDTEQHLHSVGGAWEGIQGAARSYAAALRPANANVPEGTIIWNTTSNQANFNIGGAWLDASGTPDP